MPEPAPRFSVVVPVYNEGDNICTLLRRVHAELPPPFELLIVYDFEQDNTLEAIRNMPDGERPPGLRTVRNDIGPGVRNAMVKGLNVAAAPVVVVLMADLCDELSVVETMVSMVERGAAVACASRYMKGGRQEGGPPLKKFLSRAAGKSLHWVAGVPVHDPTNAFKAYDTAFVRSTPIESVQGFTLAIELTLKAHFSSRRVEEVPTIWRDRTAGTSRFRLFKWLPEYLHWYFWAIGRRLRMTRR